MPARHHRECENHRLCMTNTWPLRQTWRAIALGSEKPSAIRCLTSLSTSCWARSLKPSSPARLTKLDESTFNAALAIIDSMQCRSELEALMAVEIIATGFSGLRFLRQSHKNMTEEYISVYGNYANKLLKLQMGLMQALDRHRRGHKQTVEVRHLHIHSGAQGVVGIVNTPKEDHESRHGQK